MYTEQLHTVPAGLLALHGCGEAVHIAATAAILELVALLALRLVEPSEPAPSPLTRTIKGLDPITQYYAAAILFYLNLGDLPT